MKSIWDETGPPEATCAVQVYPPSGSVWVQDQVRSLASAAGQVRRTMRESKIATVTLAPGAAPLRPKNTTLLVQTLSPWPGESGVAAVAARARSENAAGDDPCSPPPATARQTKRYE